MDEEKQLSSAELEQLLQVRRRQEAVEGLRLLARLSPDNHRPAGEEELPAWAGLTPPGEQPAPRRTPAAPVPSAQQPVAQALAPESWLQQPPVRLQPLQLRRGGTKRRPRRPASPLVQALKAGLDKMVDTLIVFVLVLFVLALGFYLYDAHLEPILRRMGGPQTSGSSSSLWPGQGRLSSPEEAISAPLPFVPYSSTVRIENPQIPEPTPAPGTALPSWLEIPAIQLRTSVVEVTIENGAWQVAEYAAGYHRGTARPGTIGNTVIAGHKGLAGAVFRDLDRIQVGEAIWITAGDHQYEYRVAEKRNVWPSQIEVMAPTSRPVLTLITCTTYDTQRLIVVADFVREYSTGASAAP